MDNKTTDKAVVKGTRGIAEFALKHIRELIDGHTVDFAARCPEDFDGDIEKFAAQSERWFGICDISNITNRALDTEGSILFADMYGGGWNPQVFRYDRTGYANDEGNITDLAAKLADLVESEAEGIEDNEYTYVELNMRESFTISN